MSYYYTPKERAWRITIVILVILAIATGIFFIIRGCVKKDHKSGDTIDPVTIVGVDNGDEKVAPNEKEQWGPGIIDSDGNYVTLKTLKTIVDRDDNYSDGLLRVLDSSSIGLFWGYIGKDGKYVITPQFEEDVVFVGEFHYGRAWIHINNKWGYINKKGVIIIKAQFDLASDFSEGLAAIRIDGKWRYIDTTGNYVIKPQFDDAKDFHEGYAAIKIDGKWGYINKTGIIVITPIHDYADDFVEGFARVAKNRYYGFINKRGEFITDPEYKFTFARNFSEGLAYVEYFSDSYWYQGFIGKDGEFVIGPYPSSHFENVGDFKCGLAVISINGKWGYINKEGDIIIHPQYVKARDFSEGLAAIEINNKWGYINVTGIIVINPIYDDVDDFAEGVAIVYKENPSEKPEAPSNTQTGPTPSTETLKGEPSQQVIPPITPAKVSEKPIVETKRVKTTSPHSASCEGWARSDDNAPITSRGFCYSTSYSPTINDYHTTAGSGAGDFSSTIKGLDAGTTYYIRAYATNEAGTSYGEEMECVTWHDKKGGGWGAGKLTIIIIILVVLLIFYIIAQFRLRYSALVITAGPIDKFLVIAGSVLYFFAFCFDINPNDALQPYQITLISIASLMLIASIVLSVIANLGNVFNIIISIISKIFIFIWTNIVLAILMIILFFYLAKLITSHSDSRSGTFIMEYDAWLDRWIGYRID